MYSDFIGVLESLIWHVNQFFRKLRWVMNQDGEKFLVALVKFGQSKYIIDMYENEYLFFNQMMAFRGKEKDPTGRLDPREGNLKNIQIDNLTLRVEEEEFKLHEILREFKGQFNTFPRSLSGNICSTYALLYDGAEELEIDPRMLEMGSSALIINRTGKFFNLFDSALEEMDICYKRDIVTYYDYREYDGDLTNFHKNKDFEYQSEYRFYLRTEGNEPMKIRLPGLQTVATILNNWRETKIRIEGPAL